MGTVPLHLQLIFSGLMVLIVLATVRVLGLGQAATAGGVALRTLGGLVALALIAPLLLILVLKFGLPGEAPLFGTSYSPNPELAVAGFLWVPLFLTLVATNLVRVMRGGRAT